MGSHNRLARPGLITLVLLSGPAAAGQVDVIAAELFKQAPGRFDIQVTLRHADSGWDHYADRWEILGPAGEVLATRVLYHPHVQEQPFTRGLNRVPIPASITWVKVRGHDLLHGHGGRTITLSVPH